MANTKVPFLADSGFNANNQVIRNVAYPREAELQDAVNVKYFIDENTVQPYDPSRGYERDFIVEFDKRLWMAESNINEPAGTFNTSLWIPVRTDTRWERVASGTHQALAGTRWLVRNQSQEVTIDLPDDPIRGDIVVVADEGGNISTIRARVRSSINLVGYGNEYILTKKRARTDFIYNGNEWVVNVESRIEPRVANSGNIQLFAGEHIYGKTETGSFTFTLPRYANDGDIIWIYDVDGLAPINSTTIRTHPEASTHTIGESGVTQIVFNTSGHGSLVFRASQNRWIPWNGDIRVRAKIVTSDYTPMPLDHLLVQHTSPSAVVTITLPENAADGDHIMLTNTYSYIGAKTIIKVDSTTTHTIVGDPNDYIKAKFSRVPNQGSAPSSTEVELPSDYSSPTLKLSYCAQNDCWLIDIINFRVEHVDENNRGRPGIAPLATQAEVDKNHEQNPADDQMVTPKTLSNSVSTETRRGISRIATAGEVQVVTSGTHLNDVIVTPRRLNERQATTTIRGLAEIATDAETADNSNDTHIITPQRLNTRRATEGLAGVAQLVTRSGSPGSNRASAGTGSYDYSNHTRIMTPATLNDTQATETARGVAYLATQTEANSTDNDVTIVTPKKLNDRSPTETRRGVGRRVDLTANDHRQTAANSTHSDVFITPRALAQREATESLTGITFIATTGKVNTGTDDFSIITPAKFKGWIENTSRVQVSSTDGLTISGNLWDSYQIGIQQATTTQRGTARLATAGEVQVDGGTVDNAIVTPKDLDGRRASESLAGLARIATNAQTEAGTDNTTIITPSKLLRWSRTSSNGASTTSWRGTVRTATFGETWSGNTTAGSTRPINDYVNEGYTVTPRSLNWALENYLPKTAKAVDSDLLDGIDSAQFTRRDTAQTINTNWTFSQGNEIRFANSSGGDFRIYKPSDNQLTFAATSQEFRIGDLSGGYGNNFRVETNGVVELGHARSIKLATKSAGVDVTGQLDVSGNLSSGTITQNGTTLTNTYVNMSGDTMSGDLSISKATPKFTVAATSGVSEVELSTGAHTSSFRLNTNGTLALRYNNSDRVTISSGGNLLASNSVGVGSTQVIESDARINWDKLKSVPGATTSQQGVVQLTNALDSSSQTLGATANAIRVLKELIDEKADIQGTVLDDISVNNFIQIGNVRIVPNPQTREVDFIWID